MLFGNTSGIYCKVNKVVCRFDMKCRLISGSLELDVPPHINHHRAESKSSLQRQQFITLRVRDNDSDGSIIFFFAFFPVCHRRIPLSFSKFFMCIFFLLRVLSYSIAPPQFWSFGVQSLPHLSPSFSPHFISS